MRFRSPFGKINFLPAEISGPWTAIGAQRRTAQGLMNHGLRGGQQMTRAMTRRAFVWSAAAGSLASLAGTKRTAAQSAVPVRWASLQPGFTVLPVQYILANKLGQKNGIDLP